MHTIDLAILLASTAILGIGLFSHKISRSNVTAPLLTVVAGALFGGGVLNVIPVPSTIQNDVLEEASQFSLAIALTSTALMIPTEELHRLKRPVGALLAVGMIGMWLASSGLIYLVFGVSFTLALLVGAVVSPTDPILARTVSEGELAERCIPERLRTVLLMESGLNDGLAFPFVLLALSILTDRSLLGYWALKIVLWSVIGGILLGIVIGYLLAVLLRMAQEHEWIATRYYLVFTVLMSVFAVMLGNTLKMDGFLTVFIAGITFQSKRSPDETARAREIQTTANLLFTLPVFFLLGLVLPWGAWIQLGGKSLAIVIAVLFFRRIPVVLVAWKAMTPHVHHWREALFAGWFGPIGVSALFYVTFALHSFQSSLIWPLVTLIITASIVVHGATAIPLTKALGHWEKKVGGLDEGQMGPRDDHDDGKWAPWQRANQSLD